MLTVKKTDEIIYTTATEKLDEADYEKLVPMLESMIVKHGKIRWYFEMNDFHGWTLNAFWKDLKFDISNAQNFEKIAMVGENNWQDWMTQLMKPFTSASIKFFGFSQAQEAKDWIQK